MDQYFTTAYDVTTQLFGSASGIPWWAWLFVVLTVFWKVVVPTPKTVEDRDEAMLDDLFGEGRGKKGKKKK